MFNKRLEESLAKLSSRSQLRTISDKKVPYELDFSSNDYLGLSRKLLDINQEWKVDRVGSSSSRLLCNGSDLHFELENSLANFLGFEESLLFGSGYLANIGVLSSLIRKNDFVIGDKLIHASLIDGIRLSRAKLYRAEHNNLESYERLLANVNLKRKNDEEIFIIVETLYSMDGDIAPLDELIILAKKYNAILILDEAHAIGVFGDSGRGLGSKIFPANKDRIIILGTLSKSFGAYGGFVCCSKLIKDFLINHARTFIFNTALPDFCCLAALRAINYMNLYTDAGDKVLKLSDYLKSGLKNLGFKSDSLSQIVPIVIGESELAENIAKALREKGFGIRAIRPPTVPIGTSRLRLSVTANHNEEVIDMLLKEISKLGI